MIMAEKITLLRKQNGWSQEELAEKLEVSRQSVSKWESGASIPDLDRVVKLSALFGVSVDYLVKDDRQEIAYTDGDVPAETAKCRRVTVEEADTYLRVAKRTGRGIALGAALCIFSPVCLLVLVGLNYGVLVLRPATGIGTAALLVFVAAGVALCVVNGLRSAKYDYMEYEHLELEYGVCGIVEKKRENFAPRFRLGIGLGVAGIILGVIPLVIAGAMEAPEAVDILWTAFLLLCVAAAVFAIISVSTVNDSYLILLEEGDYTPERKEIRRRSAAFPGIYWCLATALYLAVSFLTERWDMTWIVWPVAGVLYAAVLGIVRAIVRGNLTE